MYQEVADIVADALCQLVGGGEGLDAFRCVARHHAHYLLRVDVQHGVADAVGRLVDGYLATVRGIQRNIVVVESAERVVIVAGIFDDDLLGHHGHRGAHAKTGAEDDVAVGAHLRSLDYGNVKVAVEAVAQILRHMAQVRVEVLYLAAVDAGTRVLVTLIRYTQVDGVGAGQLAVHVVVGRRSGEDVDLEFLALLVELLGALRKGHCHYFGCSRGCKAREAYIITILDVTGRFFGCNKGNAHLGCRFFMLRNLCGPFAGLFAVLVG